MFAYEPRLNPFCDIWEDDKKPKLIMEKIQEICENISEKGENSYFSDIFDLLYIHIEDNIHKFLPEAEYDDHE